MTGLLFRYNDTTQLRKERINFKNECVIPKREQQKNFKHEIVLRYSSRIIEKVKCTGSNP